MAFVNIGLGNGLAPVRRQSITRINVDLLTSVPLVNFNEICIKIQTSSFRIIYNLDKSSAKYRPFCFDLNAFMQRYEWSLRSIIVSTSHNWVKCLYVALVICMNVSGNFPLTVQIYLLITLSKNSSVMSYERLWLPSIIVHLVSCLALITLTIITLCPILKWLYLMCSVCWMHYNLMSEPSILHYVCLECDKCSGDFLCAVVFPWHLLYTLQVPVHYSKIILEPLN